MWSYALAFSLMDILGPAQSFYLFLIFRPFLSIMHKTIAAISGFRRINVFLIASIRNAFLWRRILRFHCSFLSCLMLIFLVNTYYSIALAYLRQVFYDPTKPCYNLCKRVVVQILRHRACNNFDSLQKGWNILLQILHAAIKLAVLCNMKDRTSVAQNLAFLVMSLGWLHGKT